MFISLVLNACTSLRGAERTLLLLSTFLNINYTAPSWYSGRIWFLRLGYYKLNRAKEIADDWIWIVDHSVQWGKEKCLAILGIRQSQLPDAETILCHEDVEPLALFPVTKSNGDVVYEQLQETISKTGVPKQIISDHGTDVKSGIERFCQKFTDTVFVYDITHKAATVLKRELSTDDKWNAFTRLATSTRKKVQQTQLAAIAPPNQRSKARYMNVEPLVKWGLDKLCLLDSPDGFSGLECSRNHITHKLGWLTNFRRDLVEWKELIRIVKEAESFIKFQGIYRNCHVDLMMLPTFKGKTFRAMRIRTELLDFVEQESKKAGKDERLLGTSEIIESVFGKMKRLEHDQAKSGFTVFILSLATIVSKTTTEVVHKALETVPTKKIHEWFKDNIGKSVQAKRMQVNDWIKEQEQKKEQKFVF
ncbi:hypothetical protein [Desulfobacula sp.]|uniref:hypothetical protein n=1 Tax=Desulfobacula sp. TaxID=2593537 RepID=UPI00261E0397|nr:hypothetical protein [Desulfobacula sp.]